VWLFTLGVSAGCVGPEVAQPTRQVGESLVFFGDEPSPLAFRPAQTTSLQVRSTYRPGAGTVTYEEGRDYRVDYDKGTVSRLPGSRLPDFRTNVLFGREEFDHTKFPGYGNLPFFAYADYDSNEVCRWTAVKVPGDPLAAARARLAAGGPFTIVAFGDSIANGGEASSPDLVFWRRWIADLQLKYPSARITGVNGATGGDTTTRGLERLRAKVLDARPDLVLVAFGMNDHNRRGVPPVDFERQLSEIVGRVRAGSGAAVVLVSTFPPNPRWVHGSRRMDEYAAITARVALATGCAYADVHGLWQAMTVRKRPEDLLANNINHPNDFGHWIYYRALTATGL
jgi:lysophospholipase L1-like esterase